MTTKHTTGPWRYQESPNGLFDIRITGKSIATVYDFAKEGEAAIDVKEQQKANAQIMTAAPEMLAALKEAIQHLPIGSAAEEQAKKAIAKAEDGASFEGGK